MVMKFRIGIDVGGTFTDFLVTNEDGQSHIFKSLTTPRDPAQGVFEGLAVAAKGYGLDLAGFLANTTTIVHGTTITTNATLTGRGARTGFITTRGFRDILNMRRGLRANQYESKSSPPPALVPRSRIAVVSERVDLNGNVLVPLNEDEVWEVARSFKAGAVEAVAISFLWSFVNPAHERRAAEIVSEVMPNAYISISSEVLPEIRVYERHSTTVLNAYIGPPLARYLDSLEKALASAGFGGILLIMQSNGGVMSPQMASRFAVNTLLSGPAAGPIAGIHYGKIHGYDNIITCDLGGTSFDVSLVRNSTPVVTTESEVGGYHVAVPMLDIHTVGAGGGSIARVDAGGILRVGPHSAGADPGPACYGNGGDQPTTTDADLLLGYLDPDYFHGGRIKLDTEAAHRVVKERVADPLGLDVTAAADAIYRLANAHQAAAIGVVSVRRGLDPREFALVVAGGAGPIHAAPIAEELGITTILVPRESSVFCAAGMLLSDLKHDYVRSYPVEFDKIDMVRVDNLYLEMKRQAMTTLKAEGIAEGAISLGYAVDLRYVGQFNEVEVQGLHGGRIDREALGKMLDGFHRRHDELFGYSMPGAPVELINLRLTARGVTKKPRFEEMKAGQADSAAALKGRRPAYFGNGFLTVDVFEGLKLLPGHRISGPAIIEQPTTTIVVTPAFNVVCDRYGNYLLHAKGEPASDVAAEPARKETTQ